MSLPKFTESTLVITPSIGVPDVMDLITEHFPKASSISIDLSPEIFQRWFPNSGTPQVALSFYRHEPSGYVSFSVPVVFSVLDIEPFATIFCDREVLTLQPLQAAVVTAINPGGPEATPRRAASKPSKGSGSPKRSPAARSSKPRGAKKPAR